MVLNILNIRKTLFHMFLIHELFFYIDCNSFYCSGHSRFVTVLAVRENYADRFVFQIFLYCYDRLPDTKKKTVIVDY